ncbi:MAG: hypothetical protein F4Y44_06535 [Chloroflexi bacterium]|nr:hypothetical protein [Chloroflexota bacterium]
MQLQPLSLDDTLRGLPPEWDAAPLPHIAAALNASGRKIVILDDDVMGTQSVHDIAVLMDWSVDALRSELESDSRAFFVVTNARTMPESQARAVSAFITGNLCEAARQAGVDFSIVSRLDSTLRGHFPADMRAIESALAQDSSTKPVSDKVGNPNPSGWIIAPLFLEGGRFTVNDTQYVLNGEWLVPVGETEFARDPAFAFTSSNLREWVEEKTARGAPPSRSMSGDGELSSGASSDSASFVSSDSVLAADVASISIDDLRRGGPQRIAGILSALPDGGVCVVNGASNRDMEVFVQGMLQVESGGRRFLFRAAASFIKALLGQTERPLLTPAEIGMSASSVGSDNGILIVVGSYVPRTTGQLDHLLANTGAVSVEVNVGHLLADSTRQAEIDRSIRAAEDAIRSSSNAVLYTSRELVEGRSADHSLAIGHQISQAISEIVAGIGVRPRCIVVKGGATSYAVATKALEVRRAWSPGQAAPGVPAWILGDETLHPGIPCIIFPGNVGDDDALTNLVARLNDR